MGHKTGEARGGGQQRAQPARRQGAVGLGRKQQALGQEQQGKDTHHGGHRVGIEQLEPQGPHHDAQHAKGQQEAQQDHVKVLAECGHAQHIHQ